MLPAARFVYLSGLRTSLTLFKVDSISVKAQDIANDIQKSLKNSLFVRRLKETVSDVLSLFRDKTVSDVLSPDMYSR
jgi:hypothetical protein